MPLTPGTRLGPYEIVAPLGAGGMGEVHRARDTRLDREVAIKIIPPHLAANPDMRARLEREAKAISSLNHPHICALYDVGREGDVDYLVMELIDGETLSDRLARGPLPTTDVIRFGAQIADALEAAHRAGVVHRDLKPGNVMLTRTGAKLMDFGLARAALSDGGDGSAGGGSSDSPTISHTLTAKGTLVGTFQYMAPEQLDGREADARSDLWAFGCLLYEMATGRHAFEGKSQASLIGAIMQAEPAPVSQVSAMSPPALDRLVNACLTKDPDDRVQSAHDAKLQLAWIAEVGPGAASAPFAHRGRAGRRTWFAAAAAAALAVAATAATMTLLRGGPQTNPDVDRFILDLAPLDDDSAPAISADGRTVYFCEQADNAKRILRRDLDSFDAEPVAGTDGGAAPFLSPDGTWLGFATDTALKKVPIDGGPPQTIADIPSVSSAEWTPDGRILFTVLRGSARGDIGVGSVSDAGGPVETIVPTDSTRSLEYWLPELLPDGETFLVSIGASNEWRIDVVKPGAETRTLMRGVFLARYASSGHLLWMDFDSLALLAAPFDAGKAEITGPAFPITDKVDLANCFDCSPEGTVVYIPQSSQDECEIVWVDRRGLVTPIAKETGSWRQPRLSPSGDRLVVRKVMVDCELWMFDLVRGGKAQITSIGDNHNPVWAPDGRRLACRCAKPGDVSIVAMDVAAGRSSEVLLANASALVPDAWSTDGSFLACTRDGREVVTLTTAGDDRSPTPWRPDAGTASQPAISPDGRWIAYQSQDPGRKEVFLAAYPKPGRIYQVSTGGGNGPLWSRDGKELFFVSRGQFMSASVATSPELRIGLPQPMFGGDFDWHVPDNYDVSPDGSRFVMIRQNSSTGGEKELRVVRNWRVELARRGR